MASSRPVTPKVSPLDTTSTGSWGHGCVCMGSVAWQQLCPSLCVLLAAGDIETLGALLSQVHFPPIHNTWPAPTIFPSGWPSFLLSGCPVQVSFVCLAPKGPTSGHSRARVGRVQLVEWPDFPASLLELLLEALVREAPPEDPTISVGGRLSAHARPGEHRVPVRLFPLWGFGPHL